MAGGERAGRRRGGHDRSRGDRFQRSGRRRFEAELFLRTLIGFRFGGGSLSRQVGTPLDHQPPAEKGGSGLHKTAGNISRLPIKAAVSRQNIIEPKRWVGTNELRANTARPRPSTLQL